MLVEIYKEQEVSVNMEEMELHLELCKEMGITEQVGKHVKKEYSAFRKATGEEVFVYNVNFTNNVALESYNESIIPIRALQVVKEYKLAYPDYSVRILCPEPGVKDPVIIGARYYWENKDFHLIARFGEALEEFSILKAKAFKIMGEKLLNIKALSYTDLIKIAEVLAK